MPYIDLVFLFVLSRSDSNEFENEIENDIKKQTKLKKIKQN
jgi:hypothetical protein